MSLPNPRYQIPESYRLEIDRDTFIGLTDTDPRNRTKVTMAVNAARSVGIFTCADLLSLGKNQLQEVATHRPIPKTALALLYSIVEPLVECEIPQERAPQSEWPKLYDNILDASIANLLPARGPDYNFPTYRTLDFGQGHTTIGTFLRPEFEASAVSGVQIYAPGAPQSPPAQLRQIVELSARIDGLLSFREEVVIPLVRQFSQGQAPSDQG